MYPQPIETSQNMINNKGGVCCSEDVPCYGCQQRNETGTRHQFLIGSSFVYCRVDGNYWRKLAYVDKHTHIYTLNDNIYLLVPSRVLLLHLSFSRSPPSVCTQCQPVISPCKVSVVRIPVFGYCCLVKHWGRRVGVLTACVLSVKFPAVMQHSWGLRLNLKGCSRSVVTLFTS